MNNLSVKFNIEHIYLTEVERYIYGTDDFEINNEMSYEDFCKYYKNKKFEFIYYNLDESIGIIENNKVIAIIIKPYSNISIIFENNSLTTNNISDIQLYGNKNDKWYKCFYYRVRN